MVLGFKSFEYFAKALQKDPENPRINLLKGISLLYTPETYGGGASRAIEFLSKSVNLFEKENIKNPILPSWGKEEPYTFLGIAYKQKKEYDKAFVTSEEAEGGCTADSKGHFRLSLKSLKNSQKVKLVFWRQYCFGR